jgi:hypothetical protein
LKGLGVDLFRNNWEVSVINNNNPTTIHITCL